MSYPTVGSSSEALAECIALSKDPTDHSAAERVFASMKGDLTSLSPQTLEVMEHLWRELLVARRSAAFWEKVSTVERSMTDRLAEDHFQLQKNYSRLLQEQ